MKNLTNLLLSSKKENQALFIESVTELKETLEEYKTILDANFLNKLPVCLEDMGEPEEFSPLQFFWLESLEKMIYLADISLEYQDSFDPSEDLEQELYFYFMNTEFFHIFSEAEKKKQSVWEVASDILSLMQNNLLAFYYLQLASSPNETFNPPLSYLYPPELGDNGKVFYVKGIAYYRPDDEKFLKLKSVSAEGFIAVGRDKKEDQPTLVNSNHVFMNRSFNFFLASNSKAASMETLENKTTEALNTLEEFAPECFSYLKQYSQNFILLQEDNIVSYSMQNLPKYSFINIFDRDRVDFLDDLIHENGHHILNSILTSEELIEEDDDKIFYSPWRRSLRPIRGVYHAYCTFYWALNLFCELIENDIQKKELFNEKELNKISHRIYEEYLFLSESNVVLKKAKDLGKISELGWTVFNTFKDAVESKKHIFQKIKVELEASEEQSVVKDVKSTMDTIEDMRKYTN